MLNVVTESLEEFLNTVTKHNKGVEKAATCKKVFKNCYIVTVKNTYYYQDGSTCCVDIDSYKVGLI